MTLTPPRDALARRPGSRVRLHFLGKETRALRRTNTVRWISLLIGLGVAAAAERAADDGPTTYPFDVAVKGKGPAMILIPGLASSGEVWDTTVEHFKDRYECHVLTLGGFAGAPGARAAWPFLSNCPKVL